MPSQSFALLFFFVCSFLESMPSYEQCARQLAYCKACHAQLAASLLAHLQERGIAAPRVGVAAHDNGVLLRWPRVEVLCWADLQLIEAAAQRYSWVGEEVPVADLARQVEHALRLGD